MTESDNAVERAETTPKTRRFSPLLLVAGALLLAISGSVFAGAAPFAWASNLPLGWIAIIGAIVIGAAMVLTPSRRR